MAEVTLPLAAADVERTLLPLERATQLPQAAYLDPAVLAWELEHLFRHRWVCAGHVDQVRERGAYVMVEVGAESVLVVADDDGLPRAFRNVCRHRGARIVDAPEGKVGRLQCPYHAWSYGFDGSLRNAPFTDGLEDFDRACHGLRPVRLAVVEGLVLLDLSGEAPPPADHVGDLAPELARYRLGDLRRGARIVYDVEANWKAVAENYSECLHCPGVHPELTKIVPLYRKGLVWDERRDDGGVFLAEGLTTFTLSGTSDRLPELPGLSEVDRCTYYGYAVFPNLLVNLLSTGVMSYTLYPRSAGHTTIVSEYLFRPETLTADGFDPAEMVEFLDLVSRQDWTVCERAQRGDASRGFERGVYPPQDELLHRFAERYRAEMSRDR